MTNLISKTNPYPGARIVHSTVNISFLKQAVYRLLVISVVLFCTFPLRATDYYVSSSSGIDTNSGTISAPWKTLTRVNSFIPKPGDQILFKRGDTWKGTITVKTSGTSGSPITYGSWGDGTNPVISGFTTITGWNSEGGGIYSKTVISESATNNIVTIDGVNTVMGRWPNSGYMSYESHSGNTSITDNQLTSSPDWAGAELVLRRTQWTLNRNLITNITGTTITYNPAIGTWDGPTDGYGYFIQNDVKTLDVFGEWYYDGTKLYLYFGDNNPNDYTVKMSTLDKLINTTTARNYITLDNINFEGSNIAAVYTSQNSTGWNIQNCEFNYHGKDAVFAIQNSYLTLNNNSFNHCNNTGIYTKWDGNNFTITHNTLDSIGVLPGMGGIQTEGNDNNAYDAIILQTRVTPISNNVVEYNTIQKVGHCGIRISGSGYKIRNNLITDFGLVKSDGGAIYGYDAYSSEIFNNMVLNSAKMFDGIGNKSSALYGIYLDNPCNNFTISGNTVYSISSAGIYIQGSQNIEVNGNTVYDCNRTQLWIRNRSISYIVSGLNVHDNIFVAKTPGVFPNSQLCATIMTVEDVPLWGPLHNNLYADNYYARPIDDDDVFRSYSNNNGIWKSIGLTLSEWKNLSNQDVNSKKSPITVSSENDLRFEYNYSNTSKTVSLSYPMIDVKGIKYSSSVTLQPYTSILLMKDPNGLKSGDITENTSINGGNFYDNGVSTAKHEYESVKVKIYPNPSSDKVTVQLSKLPEKGGKIELTDMNGKKLINRVVQSTVEVLDLHSLPAGIYLIKLVSDDKLIINKLIIN